jgi:hypothetical protein
MADNGLFCDNHAQTIKDVISYAKTGIRADTEEGRVFGGAYSLKGWMRVAHKTFDLLLAGAIIYGTIKFVIWLT